MTLTSWVIMHGPMSFAYTSMSTLMQLCPGQSNKLRRNINRYLVLITFLNFGLTIRLAVGSAALTHFCAYLYSEYGMDILRLREVRELHPISSGYACASLSRLMSAPSRGQQRSSWS